MMIQHKQFPSDIVYSAEMNALYVSFSSAIFQLNFKYFIEMYSLGSNWQYVIIDSDNGLVPDRRQALIWTKDGLVYLRMYASLGLNDLIQG